VDEAVDSESGNGDAFDRLFNSVFVFFTYNLWLSLHGVSDVFSIRLERPESKSTRGSVTYLYDHGQIGFTMDGEINGSQNFCGTYKESIDICLLHLSCLCQRNLLRASMPARQVLNVSLERLPTTLAS